MSTLSPPTTTSRPLGDGRTALAVERPETAEALAEAVARHASQGHALYPQGGATALDYGGSPRLPGVAVDTTALGRVVDYPAADMTITIEAGMTLAALQQVLARENQRLPLEAPQPDLATLGGIFACNASGPRRFGAGRPRDLLLGVTFATSAGKLVSGGGRVVKNVAGYDFPKLLTGSLGTLGILTQLTLKVRPRPEASAILAFPFDNPDALAAALTRLNSSDTRPVALELLNQTASAMLSPEGGPALPGSPWLLLLGFEDNAASVAWQIERIAGELAPAVPSSNFRGAEADPLWASLADFPANGRGPLSFAAGLTPSAVVPFVRRLDPSNWAVRAHAGNGIVQAHAAEDGNPEDLQAAIAPLRAETAKVGGYLTLPRCPAEWKERLRVWGDPRSDWDLAAKVKAALDPAGLMNPGRFVGRI